MKPAPLCRYCGAPISKRTVKVYLILPNSGRQERDDGFLRTKRVERYPTSKAEFQRLTNDRVVSVVRSEDRSEILSFGTWDGESYTDDFFCNGEHAKSFGRVMAQAGHQTVAHEKAKAASAKKEPALTKPC